MSCKLNAIPLVALAALFCVSEAYVCYMGKQPDPSDGLFRWVLPYSKEIRCQCTKILFGGMNTVAPAGSENFFYTDTPMLFVNNDNIAELRGLLECKDVEGSTVEGSTNAPSTSKPDQVRVANTAAQQTTDKGSTVDISTNAAATSKPDQDRVESTAAQQTTDKGSTVEVSTNDASTIKPEQGRVETTTGRQTTDKGSTAEGSTNDVATSTPKQDQVVTTIGEQTTDKGSTTEGSTSDAAASTPGQDEVGSTAAQQSTDKGSTAEISTNDLAANTPTKQDQVVTTTEQQTIDKECEELTTDTEYRYRYNPSTIDVKMIEFEAQASNDVHIALTSAAENASEMYEVVIGGWNNTQSVIRRCMQCLNQVTVSTPRYLSANELRGFWISYDKTTGAIKVGKKGESCFMQWQDPNPLDIKYFGYSTLESTGVFKFCNLKSTTLPTPSDCYNILLNGNNRSDIYDIYLSGVDSPVCVFCDMRTAGGGWTVIQRRVDASVDFWREWEAYKNGFGNVAGNFWFGNEILFRLTNQTDYELRIDMDDFENETRYAVYGHFKIGDEQSNYKLSISSYAGNASNAGDSLSYHNNQPFTTKDRDNDFASNRNCAVAHTGAWWYYHCHHSNLNGKYLRGVTTESGKGITWKTWKEQQYSLKHVEMKIRPTVN